MTHSTPLSPIIIGKTVFLADLEVNTLDLPGSKLATFYKASNAIFIMDLCIVLWQLRASLNDAMNALCSA
jgi:hypothetical protein